MAVHGIELSKRDGRAAAGEAGRERIGIDDRRLLDRHRRGPFSLAYLVFNTINNLTTQEAQVACFRNVARHLEPGGCFVIEVVVPDLRRLPPGERHVVFDASERHWGIDEYDVANQGLVSHHFDTSQPASSGPRSRSGTSGRPSST